MHGKEQKWFAIYYAETSFKVTCTALIISQHPAYLDGAIQI